MDFNCLLLRASPCDRQTGTDSGLRDFDALFLPPNGRVEVRVSRGFTLPPTASSASCPAPATRPRSARVSWRPRDWRRRFSWRAATRNATRMLGCDWLAYDPAYATAQCHFARRIILNRKMTPGEVNAEVHDARVGGGERGRRGNLHGKDHLRLLPPSANWYCSKVSGCRVMALGV